MVPRRLQLVQIQKGDVYQKLANQKVRGLCDLGHQRSLRSLATAHASFTINEIHWTASSESRNRS